jgi:hypothetical protein
VPNSFSQADIPILIELILPVWKAEIERIAAKPVPTKDDLRLTLALMSALISGYSTYNMLKAQAKKDLYLQSTPIPYTLPANMYAMVKQYLPGPLGAISKDHTIAPGIPMGIKNIIEKGGEKLTSAQGKLVSETSEIIEEDFPEYPTDAVNFRKSGSQ